MRLPLQRILTWLAIAWCAALLALAAVAFAAPQRSGLLALGEILAPLLFVPLLLALPLAVLPFSGRGRRARGLLRVGLIVCAVVAVTWFGPDWVSLPASADPAALQVGVTDWNLELGEPDPAVVLDVLRATPPGIVALEELQPRHSGPIGSDPQIRARFPYQKLYPTDGSQGIGFLSSYPIVAMGRHPSDPPVIWARLDAGNGRTLDVVVAHPRPGDVQTLGPLPIPVGFDASQRDAEIAYVRSQVDPLLATGLPLVLVGDFNTTDREPAYADLSSGLVDAHVAVGLGPGSTWRPDPLKWLPFGLLRIDMVFTGNGARPIGISPDCAPRGSDHCLVRATVDVP